MPILAVVTLALFWGGSFIVIQRIVQEAPPVASAFWRVVIASVLTFIYGYLRGVGRPNLHYHRHAMVTGILGMGIPWALLFWAEQHINGALGAIMNATVPIAVVLLNPLFHRGTRVSLRQWLGILTSFAGIVVIFGPKVVTGPSADGLAILALVGMVVCYSTALSYTHRFLKEAPATLVAGWQGVSAAVLLLLIATLKGESVITPVFWQNQTVWMGILYLAICSTFIANILFVVLIQARGSIAASLITFLIPIVSMGIEWLGFGIAPSRGSAAGLVLVLGGLYIVQFYRPGRRLRALPQTGVPTP